MLRKKLFALTAATAIAATSAFAGSANKDIVDTAVSAGTFETLVAAVSAADLVDTLKSEGPFTVFAQTNEAFAKVPAAILAHLLVPRDCWRCIVCEGSEVLPDGQDSRRRFGEDRLCRSCDCQQSYGDHC